jgi:hypothetical protein
MGSGRITAPNIDNITTGVRSGNEIRQIFNVLEPCHTGKHDILCALSWNVLLCSISDKAAELLFPVNITSGRSVSVDVAVLRF